MVLFFLRRSSPAALARPLVLRTHARRPLSYSNATPDGPHYRAARMSLATPLMILAGIVPIFCFTLGTWQVQRLKWKINLLDELREKLEREPLSLPPRVNLTALPEFTYRKVMLKGIWDHEHAILVGPRVRDGTAGFHIITPLRRPNGSTVIVDRGFVSKEQAQAALRAHEPLGEVEVLGMLRTSQTRNNFTPDNHPEQGIWYWADVEAMTEHAGGTAAGVQPVFIEEIFEGHSGEATARVQNAIPVGRAPSVDLPNSHLSYAVTWYSLSAFTTFMFARLFLKGRQSTRRLPR